MPVNGDDPVVSEVEWQSAQPILLNRLEPFCVDGDCGPGVAGAESRMNAAKFTMSDDISDAVPIWLPKFKLALLVLTSTVASSGDTLNTQPDTALRSLGKTSFDTPCSTL